MNDCKFTCLMSSSLLLCSMTANVAMTSGVMMPWLKVMKHCVLKSILSWSVSRMTMMTNTTVTRSWDEVIIRNPTSEVMILGVTGGRGSLCSLGILLVFSESGLHFGTTYTLFSGLYYPMIHEANFETVLQEC